MKRAGPFALTIFLWVLLSALAARAEQAPDFTTQDAAGNPVKLSALHGKVVLIDFWATWCPPCRAEIPNMLDIFGAFRNRDFVIIGISLDLDEAFARRFVRDKRMNWLQVINIGEGSRLAQLYGVEYIPHTVLIDRQGNIIARELQAAELKEAVARQF